ncbi:HNH endonuclease signature motif containing protein [Microbacterium gorillae]|uniref:HNH endonuclease signature motif containing protein n=1 Tax=Microbacterium gorillae TaxID=1231063 RepID=UPI0018A86812|nr:HNH endonuclease signature motif containing protein [Microbacterium gorillae]
MAFDAPLPNPGHRWQHSGTRCSPGSDARMSALVSDALMLQRQIACLQARQETVFAAVADVAEHRAEGVSARAQEHELIIRDVAAELGAALHVSDRVIQGRLADAAVLVHEFPRTHTALEDGRITMSHARVIVHAGSPIEDPGRREAFEATAVPVAEGTSAGRLRARVKRDADASRTDSLDDRHRKAREGRYVVVEDGDDGMSEIHACIPTLLAHGISDRLHAHARRIRRHHKTGPGDARTMSQITADVFCDLLLTTDPATAGDALSSIRAQVQITIPATVLTGQSGSGAELVGVGPIDPDTARTLAGIAPGWDRLFLHPATGMVTSVDRYRPSAGQRRILRVRDEHCRFPGCRYPAIRSDADHTIDAARGGPTAISNLGHFCRRHHTLKHHTRWSAENLPGGVIRWTSPLGTIYTDHPPRTVVFTPGGGDGMDETIPPF